MGQYESKMAGCRMMGKEETIKGPAWTTPSYAKLMKTATVYYFYKNAMGPGNLLQRARHVTCKNRWDRQSFSNTVNVLIW